MTSTEFERASAAELAAWQATRVGEVIQYARSTSGFYRRRWLGSGVDGIVPSSLDELGRFPIVDKRELVAAGDDWLRSGDGTVGFSTRGTSGQPLLLWLDRAESDAYVVPTARGFRWAGFRPGMTALLLSPVWHRLAAMEGHAVIGLGGRATYFWGSLGGSEHVDSFLDALTDVRPDFVTSTPPFLLNALRRLEDAGRDPRAVFDGVVAVVLVGLPLTTQFREFLQQRLGVPHVFERGGTQEGVAFDDCELHTTPHVHADVCFLEVLDNEGRALPAGERGRLIVTKLVAGGSPFVRYDTGDVAAFAEGPCACGRTLSRLRIFGRPESSVEVGGRLVTAFDARSCVDADPELVGRLVLLVRGAKPSGVLQLVVEGRPGDETGLKERLRERLLVDDAEVRWLGDVRVSWGFRQVVEESELRAR